MWYCRPNETFTLQWRDHGLSHCFLETLIGFVPLIFLAPAALAQWLYYRKYAAQSGDYQRPRNAAFATQVVLHILLIMMALVRLLVQYTFPSLADQNDQQLFGYQLSAALCSCSCWLLSFLLVMLERRQMLPSAPSRRHGLPLLVGWILLLAAELSVLVNCRSTTWWFDPQTDGDIAELVLFTFRLTGSFLAFVIGLKSPGMAWVEDFIPYMIQMPLLGESDVQLNQNHQQQQSSWSEASAALGSTWRAVVYRLHLLLHFLWPRGRLRLTVVFCFVLMLLSRFVNVLVPIYSRLVVDSLLERTSGPPLLEIACLTLFVFLSSNGAGGVGFLDNIRIMVWQSFLQNSERQLQLGVFAHLHRLSSNWHYAHETGQIFRTMERGANAINTLLSDVFFSVLPMAIDVLLAIVFISYYFNVWLGLIVGSATILYVVATIAIANVNSNNENFAHCLRNRQREKGVDSLYNFETVKCYDAEQYELQRYRQAVMDRQKAENNSEMVMRLVSFIQKFLACGGLLLGSVLCAYLVFKKPSFTVGDYVFFVTYMYQLHEWLSPIGIYHRNIQENTIDMDKFLNLLEESPDISDIPAAPVLQPGNGSLEFRGVSFHYDPEQPVLNDLSFSILPRQKVAIVGPPGSGKSTIIQLIFRLFDPCQGQILLDNQDILQVQQGSVRQEVGLISQNTVLFRDTIGYNIRYGRRSASDEEVKQAAKAAGIHRRILAHLDGYNTQVGAQGFIPSESDRQRIAIARILLKAPTFILIDDVMSELVADTQHSIQSTLHRLCSGHTTLIATRRLSTTVDVDLILVLEDGCIVERGSHEELIDQGGVYFSMWQEQAAEERRSSPVTTRPSDDHPANAAVSTNLSITSASEAPNQIISIESLEPV